MTNSSPASSASSLPAFDYPPLTPSPVPASSSSSPARITTTTTATTKQQQQPAGSATLEQEPKEHVERKKGTLRIEVHGLRNLKPPTPENLGRAYPRHSSLSQINDFVLVATLGNKQWESRPCYPPYPVAVFFNEKIEFEDVSYPPLGPGVEFSVRYRDANGRTVAQWQTAPVAGEDWSLTVPSSSTSITLFMAKFYGGDVRAKIYFTFNKATPLLYKPYWKKAGRLLALPPSLLPCFLHDQIDTFLGWFLDGLLFLSQTLPTFSPSLPSFAFPPFLQRSWRGKALFCLMGFVMCASVSFVFAGFFALALFFAPVTALLLVTSLLASIGLGAPAVLLMGFLLTFPSVDDKIFQPCISWAVNRLPLVGRVMLEGAGEKKRE